MTLPSDVDLTKMSDTYVEKTMQNEIDYIRKINIQIEALSNERDRHNQEYARYNLDMIRRKGFKVGQHVRHTDGTTGVIVVAGDLQSTWLEVQWDNSTVTMWWSPEATTIIEDTHA